MPENGVRVKNIGDDTVYVGGPDVGSYGEGTGFPIEPGMSEDFPGVKPRESPVVPAPDDDMAPPVLYGRTASGGPGKVSFISLAMT